MLAIRHQRPKPQIDFGRILRESGASSLNDVSDGLSREINEIASASRVTIELEKNGFLCLMNFADGDRTVKKSLSVLPLMVEKTMNWLVRFLKRIGNM